MLECLICNNEYLKSNFIKCNQCKNKICFNCYKQSIFKNKNIYNFINFDYKQIIRNKQDDNKICNNNKQQYNLNNALIQSLGINKKDIEAENNYKKIKFVYNCFICRTINYIKLQPNNKNHTSLLIYYLFNSKYRTEYLLNNCLDLTNEDYEAIEEFDEDINKSMKRELKRYKYNDKYNYDKTLRDIKYLFI